MNYDTCHFAVEFEEPQQALAALQQHRIKLSKIHLSNALKIQPTPEALAAVRAFADDVYLHQVVVCRADGQRMVYRDLPDALAQEGTGGNRQSPIADSQSPIANPPSSIANPPSSIANPPSPIANPPSPISERPSAIGYRLSAIGYRLSAIARSQPSEWRIHFHIPLHCPPSGVFGNTSDHLLGVLDALAANPALCAHLEMETYTWEVLPPELKNRSVVEQLVAEYEWTLRRLSERGLAVA